MGVLTDVAERRAGVASRVITATIGGWRKPVNVTITIVSEDEAAVDQIGSTVLGFLSGAGLVIARAPGAAG